MRPAFVVVNYFERPAFLRAAEQVEHILVLYLEERATQVELDACVLGALVLDAGEECLEEAGREATLGVALRGVEHVLLGEVRGQLAGDGVRLAGAGLTLREDTRVLALECARADGQPDLLEHALVRHLLA